MGFKNDTHEMLKDAKTNDLLASKNDLEKYIGKEFESNNYGVFTILGVFDKTKHGHKRYLCQFKNTNGFGLASISNILKGIVSDSLSRKYAYDITDQRFGKLIALELVRTESKGREWLCQCDCGNTVITKQRNLLGKEYMQRSCGCIRKKAHLVKTSKIELSLDYVDSFDNFEKYVFLHKAFVGNDLTNAPELYFEFIDFFYNQKQFNAIYDNWVLRGKVNQKNTFYNWLKPSLDHIIPKSRIDSIEIKNYQFLTVFENLAKRDMTMDEWSSFLEETNTCSDLFKNKIMGVN
jgi:hypothetical protein